MKRCLFKADTSRFIVAEHQDPRNEIDKQQGADLKRSRNGQPLLRPLEIGDGHGDGPQEGNEKETRRRNTPEDHKDLGKRAEDVLSLINGLNGLGLRRGRRTAAIGTEGRAVGDLRSAIRTVTHRFLPFFFYFITPSRASQSLPQIRREIFAGTKETCESV